MRLTVIVHPCCHPKGKGDGMWGQGQMTARARAWKGNGEGK